MERTSLYLSLRGKLAFLVKCNSTFVMWTSVALKNTYSRYVTSFSGIGFWAISSPEVFVAKICYRMVLPSPNVLNDIMDIQILLFDMSSKQYSIINIRAEGILIYSTSIFLWVANKSYGCLLPSVIYIFKEKINI